MPYEFAIDNIETYPYTINNTTEVNPRPMDDVQVQLVNGELQIYMRGTVGLSGELPGALVGFKLPVVNTVLDKQMLYSGLNYEIKLDEVSLAVVRCVETDLRWCREAASDPSSPIANLTPGDAQKNNGVWEIYNDWVGKTGFSPGQYTANVFNKVALRHTVNPATASFWFASITDMGKTFAVKPSLMPLLVSDWTDTGVQLQLCLQRSGFAIATFRNVSALFSDAPIPI